MVQLGSYYPQWRPGLCSWLLALTTAWGHCRHFGNEPSDGSAICLSPALTLSHTLKFFKN